MRHVNQTINEHEAATSKLTKSFEAKRARLMAQLDKLNGELVALNEEESQKVVALMSDFDAKLSAARTVDMTAEAAAVPPTEPAAETAPPAPVKRKARKK